MPFTMRTGDHFRYLASSSSETMWIDIPVQEVVEAVEVLNSFSNGRHLKTRAKAYQLSSRVLLLLLSLSSSSSWLLFMLLEVA